ncbi:MAG: GNAT family N-acetyltransferase [Firmicutes bacterium]|nr:GNAT family N-acetyltransferase [Bacillota bacterium]
MKTLKTKRLILRNFSESDAFDLFDYAKLETVGPNAGWAPHQTVDESLEIIKKFIESNDVWAVELRSNHKVIGSVGLHERMTIQGEKVKELGYVLSTSYEGKGLMTEACRRVLQYAFEEEKVQKIKVAHFLGNEKSKRVIEKCGFEYEKEGTHQSIAYGPKLSKVYQMTIENYKKIGGNK